MTVAVVKTCEFCGDEFKPYRSNAKWCSETCRSEVRRRRSRDWHHQNKERSYATVVAWRKANPERQKENARRLATPENNRRNLLKYNYGLTVEEYDRLLVSQGGVCAVCGKPPGAKALAVDHDHVTGRIRGLLHPFPCNYQFIGRHRDPSLYERAAEYLRNPPAEQVLGERVVPRKKKSRSRGASVTRTR